MAENNTPKNTPNRTTSRKRVLFPGIIVHGQGVYTCDCLLRDVSPEGARIVVKGHPEIPERFFLINIKEGMAHDARRMWSKGQEIGVKFESAIPLGSNTDLAFRKLRQLWLAKLPH